MARRMNVLHCRSLVGLLSGLAAALIQAAPEGSVSNADGSAWISARSPHRFASVLLDSDDFSSRISLPVRSADVGQRGELFLAARFNDSWFMKAEGRWLPWNGRIASLLPAGLTLLEGAEEVNVLDGQRLQPGDYSVYAGYRAGNGPLRLVSEPLDFTVRPAAAAGLQRFASPEAMEAYLKEALASGAREHTAYLPFIALRGADAAAGGASSTNLQVAGVDEADTVKTDGEVLYALQGCELESCLAVYALDPGVPAAAPLATYELKGETSPDGLYLMEDRDLLVSLGGRNAFGHWFDIWGWSGNKTEVEFFDTADPRDLVSREKLSIDGSLVASRVVDGTLYLVTRYTPVVEGFQPYPLDGPQERRNEDVLDRVGLPQLLPRVVDSRDKARDLIESKDCYLPTSAVDEGSNPSIITITAMPLDAPDAFRSTCFLGGSETLYMTAESLYLATTSQDYSILARDALVYEPDHSTAIHKFALSGGGIEYRGSGELEGHLGWNEDYKSFRLGENEGYLNVVTSTGDTWNGSADTQLHVLKEGPGDTLETVRTISGIGKPGEQLHAARFLGDRAFLVTFRLTDPLYMVDLSDQENPRIAGELEVEGYSEYLHPVSANLLLGVGKHAVPDTGSSIGDGRGAFAQGVKLSLFDVSDPAAMREIDSVVLGERGTESPVLWDHHAFTFLPAGGGEPMRVAIPVQLHDTPSRWEGFDPSAPDAWYDYTHTALYGFEVSELGIARAGRVIGSEAADLERPVEIDRLPELTAGSRLILPWRPSYADRSVLVGDAVFYLHQGKVLSARWGESR